MWLQPGLGAPTEVRGSPRFSVCDTQASGRGIGQSPNRVVLVTSRNLAALHGLSPCHRTGRTTSSPPNIVILKSRVANPTASTRELSEILEADYGIELSHNRISEILREMAEDGLYRETVIPDQSIFNHYLFRLSPFTTPTSLTSGRTATGRSGTTPTC